MDSSGLPRLPLSVFECRFELDDPPRLPAYAGSTWRGAFGHALKRTVCVARGTPCPECLLYRTCSYPYVFETPPPAGSLKMRLYTAAPHPFALRIESAQQGLRYRLGMTVFGRAERYLAYMVHALAQAGEAGIGRSRQVFRLFEVAQIDEHAPDGWRVVHVPGSPLEPLPARIPDIPPTPAEVEVRLLSPLRLKVNDRLVIADEFRFAHLFGSLLRRMSMLTYFHTDSPLETDFGGLTTAAAGVELTSADLHWHDWTRFSSRQHSLMEMGGLLGSFRVSGAGLEPFWPYLWLGQWTHAGKAATMGLGRYELTGDGLPAAFGQPRESSSNG